VTRRFEVLISPEAERDIEEIYRYIAEHDGIVNATNVLAGIESACSKLSELPRRGNVPKELQRIGITEYRENHFKPYRIIYRAFSGTVVVYCVLDGRRDMQTLLQRRLLRE
jgi:toxin ParE1/3/4